MIYMIPYSILCILCSTNLIYVVLLILTILSFFLSLKNLILILIKKIKFNLILLTWIFGFCA
jgi:hypothetical protein